MRDYYKAKHMKEGNDKDVKGRGHTLAYQLAIKWFHKFAKNADYVPTNNTRALSSCLSKAAVYQIYKEHMEKTGKPFVARSTFFYNVWKKHFPNVTITKVTIN